MMSFDDKNLINCHGFLLCISEHIKHDLGLAAAIGYLLRYNRMLILPQVGILIIGYLGVKSEYMGNFLRRRLAVFKFGMAALFTGLGVLVMGTVW